MNAVLGWEAKIQDKLKAAADHRREVQEHLHQQMAEVERREQHLCPIADRLMQSIIRPRMEKLTVCFENAHLLPPDATGPHRCVCEFGLTDWFPAKARLELAVSTNGLAENLLVQYTLQIVPPLFSFSGESEIVFPFDRIDERRLTAWVEERLVSFADTYLRVESLEPYQSENLVTDPVCGMLLHKALAGGKEEYQGRNYYFCVEQCRKQFLADPARYVREGG